MAIFGMKIASSVVISHGIQPNRKLAMIRARSSAGPSTNPARSACSHNSDHGIAVSRIEPL